MANKYMHEENHHPNDSSDIETPLSDKIKGTDTLAKNFLKVPALMGDAAYNVGRAIKKKITG